MTSGFASDLRGRSVPLNVARVCCATWARIPFAERRGIVASVLAEKGAAILREWSLHALGLGRLNGDPDEGGDAGLSRERGPSLLFVLPSPLPPGGRGLPKHLIVKQGGAGDAVAIPVEPLDYGGYRVAPQDGAPERQLVAEETRGSGGVRLGVVAALVRMPWTGDDGLYALSCHHVLGFSRYAASVLRTHTSHGAVRLGTTRFYGLMEEHRDADELRSMDVALARVDDTPRMRERSSPVDYSGFVQRQEDLPERFGIYTARRWIDATLNRVLFDFEINYTVRGRRVPIVHQELVECLPAAQTIGGDSGSPVSAVDHGRGFFLGMHIAGGTNAEGQSVSIVLPSYRALLARGYRGMTRENRWLEIA